MSQHIFTPRSKTPASRTATTSARPHAVQRKCACGASLGLAGMCTACTDEQVARAPHAHGTGAHDFGQVSVSQPGDPAEVEADRVAEQVVRMPAGPRPGTPGHSGPGLVQLSRASAETRAADSLSSLPPAVGTALGAPGQPLDAASRELFEPRFGWDLSAVRIHTDSRAAEAARSVHARAFTLGTDIVFGTGEYRPGTGEGQLLLAHELAHVVQQASTSNGALLSRACIAGTWHFECDGCSLPKAVGLRNNPVGAPHTQFSNVPTGMRPCGAADNLPCDNHDRCYQTPYPEDQWRSARLRCDNNMLRDMLDVCERPENAAYSEACLRVAKIYHEGLRDLPQAEQAFVDRQAELRACALSRRAETLPRELQLGDTLEWFISKKAQVTFLDGTSRWQSRETLVVRGTLELTFQGGVIVRLRRGEHSLVDLWRALHGGTPSRPGLQLLPHPRRPTETTGFRG